jgi:hypothetical protein
MGRTPCVIVALALGACAEQPTLVVEHASALARWTIDGTVWWHPTPDVSLNFGPTGASDCHVLAQDVSATFDGAPLALEYGGLTTDPDTGHTECKGPSLGFPIPSTARPDTPFDLVISDSTAEIHVSLVGVMATRSVTLDGGGSLMPGTTATVRWAPTTDDLEPPVRYNDIALGVSPPIFPTLHTDDGTLIRSGNAFSFAVPSTNNQHYTLSCYLDMVVYATVDTCDFASCKIELRLPGAYDFPFTLTI